MAGSSSRAVPLTFTRPRGESSRRAGLGSRFPALARAHGECECKSRRGHHAYSRNRPIGKRAGFLRCGTSMIG